MCQGGESADMSRVGEWTNRESVEDEPVDRSLESCEDEDRGRSDIVPNDDVTAQDDGDVVGDTNVENAGSVEEAGGVDPVVSVTVDDVEGQNSEASTPRAQGQLRRGTRNRRAPDRLNL